MENSVHNRCTSTWQSVSSSSGDPQPSLNQMERNAGQYLYPCIAEGSRSTRQGRPHEAAFPNTVSLGSNKSNRTEMGNPFLAFLSGSPSLLACDIQHMTNNKTVNVYPKVPIFSGGVMGNRSAGSGVPLIINGGQVDTLSIQRPRKRTVSGAIVPSNAVMTTNCSGATSLTNLNFQIEDKAMPVIPPTVAGNGNIRNNSSFRAERDSMTKSTYAVNPHLTNSESSQQKLNPYKKISTEKSSPHRPSGFLSGCPRVLCSSICGDLLLSNTGLLGVVCSCHCLHMSISKFCEHSGLSNVNPGEAVHMDNGEPIAQWRRLYFQKFGIRVPDDQSGWEWPECFSANAGLVNSSWTIPSINKNTDHYPLNGSQERSETHTKSQDKIQPFEKFGTYQKHAVNLLHNKQQKIAQSNGEVSFKGLIEASHCSTLGMSESQQPVCSRVSNSVDKGRSNNDRESIPAHTDSVSRSKNTFISQPTLQYLRTHATNSEFNLKKVCNVNEAISLDQDGVSSNIELRLGQPYQQSWTTGSTFLSVVKSKPLDTLGDTPMSISRDHSTHKNQNIDFAKKYNQYPQWVSGRSNSSTKRTATQSNFRNHTLEANIAEDRAKVESSKEDKTNNSVISMLLSHINSISGDHAHSRTYHNLHNEHSVHGIAHCESLISKPYPINFPWNGADGLVREMNIKECDLLNQQMYEDKEVRCSTRSSYFVVEPDDNLRKRMQNSNVFNGVVGGSSNHSITSVNDRNSNPGHFYGMPLDVSAPSSFSNYSGKASSTGHLAMGIGFFSPQKASPVSFPLGSSVYTPNVALPSRGVTGICPSMVDENLRLLALRQMLELSKQNDTNSSPGNKQQYTTPVSSSTEKISGTGPLDVEQLHLHDITNKNNMSKAILKSSQPSDLLRVGVDVEKFASKQGFNNWCSVSTSVQGSPLCTREIDAQGQSSLGTIPNDPHPLRLGRSESIISCDELGKSYQRVPCTRLSENCSSAIPSKNLVDCNSKLDTSSNVLKGQTDDVSHKDLLDSNIDPGELENSISLEQSVTVDNHVPKKITFHSFQWKDVPNKVTRTGNVSHLADTANVLEGSRSGDKQLEDFQAKSPQRIEQDVITLKRKDMSTISSAVMHVSDQFANADSCTVDEGGAQCCHGLVVDEESANDKCDSSADVLCNDRSIDFVSSTSKSGLMINRSSNPLTDSSCNLLDNLKLLDSLRWKKLPNKIQKGPISDNKSNQPQNADVGKKGMMSDRDPKGKMLDASLIASGISSVINGSPKASGGVGWQQYSSVPINEQTVHSEQEISHSLNPTTQGLVLRRKCSSFSSTTASRKRDFSRVYNNNSEENDGYETDLSDTSKSDHRRISHIKRIRIDSPPCPSKNLGLPKSSFRDPGAVANLKPKGSVKAESSKKKSDLCWNSRLTVSGKYGVILNSEETTDVARPAKIVPLSKVLARCKLSESYEASKRKLKKKIKTRTEVRDKAVDFFRGLAEKNSDELNIRNSLEAKQKTSIDKEIESLRFKKERDARRVKRGMTSTMNCETSSNLKAGEIQNQNQSELKVTALGTKSRGAPQKKFRSLEMLSTCGDNTRDLMTEERGVSVNKHGSIMSEPGACCCVCGDFDKEESNHLLECSQCSIRVHQACYGVAKVPKGYWCCRPCRTNCKDIACVLCGYGGGAMTRALNSHNIVNNLLNAWIVDTENRTNTGYRSYVATIDELNISYSINFNSEGVESRVITPVIPETPVILKGNMRNQSDILRSIPVRPIKLKNSITSGALDPTVKQWVHMVCGLWTPETRCPNVDTMSAFDVSGVPPSRTSVVCSICKCPGGSCIQCRVVNCFVRFHPWCAHKKGLLQSELEGAENECVGFYGRCVFHATDTPNKYIGQSNYSESVCPVGKELTSARTEGYKGRKRDGVEHNIYSHSNGNAAGCLVPQEQLDAWLHINGQKSCSKSLLKQLVIEIEHDFRKEYARYRLTKGWKHLVVYKSGIHALGLYTSRFISRSAMVVEYVGEIVGVRVADKREREYLSGRNLQYKSACYFFRIDKEHIIDATCKGGIARFVNHSCTPNSVAKVISVRNKKKVVFFAERDIYPGEEITYDYHFNHEDEGKKIRCFCNSKNCRRYMN